MVFIVFYPFIVFYISCSWERELRSGSSESTLPVWQLVAIHCDYIWSVLLGNVFCAGSNCMLVIYSSLFKSLCCFSLGKEPLLCLSCENIPQVTTWQLQNGLVTWLPFNFLFFSWNFGWLCKWLFMSTMSILWNNFQLDGYVKMASKIWFFKKTFYIPYIVLSTVSV